jgi:hypothetical protein
MGKTWSCRVTSPTADSWLNIVVHAREGLVTVGQPDHLGWIGAQPGQV